MITFYQGSELVIVVIKFKRQGKKLGSLLDTKMSMNWPPMAPHRFTLSQDGATPSKMLFRQVLDLFDAMFSQFQHKMGPRGVRV